MAGRLKVLDAATALHAVVTVGQLYELRELAQKTGRSQSDLVREALGMLFEQQQKGETKQDANS